MRQVLTPPLSLTQRFCGRKAGHTSARLRVERGPPPLGRFRQVALGAKHQFLGVTGARASSRVLESPGGGDWTSGDLSDSTYAAYYAAMAALLAMGEQPRPHTGALTRFNAISVVTGRVPAQTARTFRRTFGLRQGADYDFAATFSAETAASLADEVEQFIRDVKHLVV